MIKCCIKSKHSREALNITPREPLHRDSIVQDFRMMLRPMCGPRKCSEDRGIENWSMKLLRNDEAKMCFSSQSNLLWKSWQQVYSMPLRSTPWHCFSYLGLLFSTSPTNASHLPLNHLQRATLTGPDTWRMALEVSTELKWRGRDSPAGSEPLTVQLAMPSWRDCSGQPSPSGGGKVGLTPSQR